MNKTYRYIMIHTYIKILSELNRKKIMEWILYVCFCILHIRIYIYVCVCLCVKFVHLINVLECNTFNSGRWFQLKGVNVGWTISDSNHLWCTWLITVKGGKIALNKIVFEKSIMNKSIPKCDGLYGVGARD